MRGYRSRDPQQEGLPRIWSHADATCAEHFILPHHEVSLVARLGAGDGDLAIYGPRSRPEPYRPVPGVRSVAVVLAPACTR